jgi:hypothetical protein
MVVDAVPILLGSPPPPNATSDDEKIKWLDEFIATATADSDVRDLVGEVGSSFLGFWDDLCTASRQSASWGPPPDSEALAKQDGLWPPQLVKTRKAYCYWLDYR